MTTAPRPRYTFFATDPDEIFRQERRAWVRAIAACVLGTISRTRPETILKRTWPDDAKAALTLKAATTPTMLGDFPSEQRVWELPVLAPQSAALKLFDESLLIDMSGIATIRIPGVTAQPSVTFVGEGQPAPAKQFTLASGAVLGPVKKILVLAAVTRELESASPTAATTIIGRILAAAIEKEIDTVAFGTGAGDAATPAGLFNGVGALSTPTAGGGVQALTGDISQIASAMAGAGVDPSEMILVASAAEATKIKLISGPNFDLKVFATLGLPAKTLAAFAPRGIAAAYEGAPSIQTSSEQATVSMNDPGAPAMTSPTSNMFHQDLISIRLRSMLTWIVATPGAAQFISNVSW